jgi:uncharacterized protein YuzE
MDQELSLVPAALLDPARVSGRPLRVDYDEKADVLYISFGRPEPATDTAEADADVLVRTRGRRVVGITILNARMYPRVRVTLPGRSRSARRSTRKKIKEPAGVAAC